MIFPSDVFSSQNMDVFTMEEKSLVCSVRAANHAPRIKARYATPSEHELAKQSKTYIVI